MYEERAGTATGRIQIDRCMPVNRVQRLARRRRYSCVLRVVAVAAPGNAQGLGGNKTKEVGQNGQGHDAIHETRSFVATPVGGAAVGRLSVNRGLPCSHAKKSDQTFQNTNPFAIWDYSPQENFAESLLVRSAFERDIRVRAEFPVIVELGVVFGAVGGSAGAAQRIGLRRKQYLLFANHDEVVID